jgi:hypothetical protein
MITRAARVGLVFAAILTLVLPFEFARACAMVFPRFMVFSNFDLIVKVPDGQPLDGIRVAIDDLELKPRPTDTTVAVSFTDNDGHASFRGVKPGHYFVFVERGKITGEDAELDVVESGGLTTFQLKWPDSRIYTTERIQGTLLRAGIPGVPNMAEDKTLANVDLTLTEAISAREVGRTSTDGQGKFAFREVVPGLYAMHMKWHGIEGYVLLEVDIKTKDTGPSIYSISPTDCGLGLGKRDE